LNDPGQEGLFEETPPQPLRGSGAVYIGTSGFSFADWEGSFYPPHLPRREWLSYYAREFCAVEINATYYRLPPASSFTAMAERTPESCRFWVKVPGEATHGRGDVKSAMNAFRESVKPLSEARKLVGALAQFPHSFRYSKTSLEHLEALKLSCGGLRLAVEFRSDDWRRGETLEFLRLQELINVTADLPRLTGLPTNELSVSSSVAYLRFHGRNAAAWYDSNLGDRYNYDYSPAEIAELARLVKSADEQALASYVFFNNCHMGLAVKNARMLRQILEGEFQSFPSK